MLNWRAAIAGSGIIAALYGVFYYFNVTDTPPGKVYRRPESARGIEVTTVRDFWFLMAMNVPLTAILMVIAWRLQKVGFLSVPAMFITMLLLLGLYAFQAYNCWTVNKDLLAGRKRYPAEDRYRFKQVAILELTYIVNFGSELAVVSVLPAFFEGTFGLDKAAAGMIAASYAFMNLVSRPGGGIISDSVGSRKWTMTVLLGGMGIGYLLFSMVSSGWWLPGAVLLVMACSFFVQAAEGATFALVPLVKPRITGQVAGNVGAYGNVGAVAYLTILLLLQQAFVPAGDGVDPAVIAAGTARANALFFQVLGVAGLIVAFLCAFFLDEPKNSFADAHEGEEMAIPVVPADSSVMG